jgi:hypothetical protein
VRSGHNIPLKDRLLPEFILSSTVRESLMRDIPKAEKTKSAHATLLEDIVEPSSKESGTESGMSNLHIDKAKRVRPI